MVLSHRGSSCLSPQDLSASTVVYKNQIGESCDAAISGLFTRTRVQSVGTLRPTREQSWCPKNRKRLWFSSQPCHRLCTQFPCLACTSIGSSCTKANECRHLLTAIDIVTGCQEIIKKPHLSKPEKLVINFVWPYYSLIIYITHLLS